MQIDGWLRRFAAAGVVRGGERRRDARAARRRSFRWASVTKLVTALAALVAAEEGVVDLDEPAGPEGSTVRHLLAHASGLPFETGAPTGRPGQRRSLLEPRLRDARRRTSASAPRCRSPTISRRASCEPLGMRAELRGSPAADLYGSLDDLLIASPASCSGPRSSQPETLAEATTVQFPGLAGVLPDFGRFDPNDWGLGFELRDARSRTGPAHTTRRGHSVTSVAAARSSGSIPKPVSRSASSRTSSSASGRRKPGRVCRMPCCSRNTRVPVSYPCLAPVRPPAHAAGSCLT